MLETLIKQMLPPGALDEFVNGSKAMMERVQQIELTLKRIEEKIEALTVESFTE